nr:reverse transcriptase domain-containing protein [Tanacetum cinerariifolium]
MSFMGESSPRKTSGPTNAPDLRRKLASKLTDTVLGVRIMRQKEEDQEEKTKLSHRVKKDTSLADCEAEHRRVHPPKEANRISGQVRTVVAPGQRNKTRRKTRRACESRKERGSSQQRKSYGNFHGPALATNNKIKDHPELLHRPRNFFLNTRRQQRTGNGNRDEEHSTNTLMNFMVVRSPSPYNGHHRSPRSQKNPSGPIYRSWNAKIPSERRNSNDPQYYHNMSGMVTEAQDACPPKEPAVTEGVKIAIHPEYPDQTVMIGEGLSEKGRMELCNLLKENLDVFAWKPADITGALRSIAEHLLNIREGCQPVRQKRRGQSPDRNKAIQEEVAKPVEAEIMREVHYHDWLSNPVMDTTKYIWQKRTRKKRLSTPAKEFSAIQKCRSASRMLEKLTSDSWIRHLKNRLAETWKSVPRSHSQHEGDQGLSIKSGSSDEATITPICQVRGKVTPFLQNTKKMRKKSDFQWTPEAEKAFQNMKKCIAELRMVTAPKSKEELTMPRTSICGQILADFIAEKPDEEGPSAKVQAKETVLDLWTLFTDGSSCLDGSGAKLILTSPEGEEFTYALSQSRFPSRSKPNQWVVPQSENKKVDALSKIASISFAHLTKQVLVETLKRKSIEEREILAIVEEEWYFWMTPLIEYLTKGTLTAETKKARTIKIKARQYIMINGSLYKNSFLEPWLRFGLPGEIISDNGKQFRDNPFKDRYEKLNIKQRLGKDDRDWAEEVPHVLWAHRTMIKTSNEDTSFSLTYGTEAVIPVEIGMPLLRYTEVNQAENNEATHKPRDSQRKKRKGNG